MKVLTKDFGKKTFKLSMNGKNTLQIGKSVVVKEKQTTTRKVVSFRQEMRKKYNKKVTTP